MIPPPKRNKSIIYTKHKPQKHDECSQSCQVRPDHHEIWTQIQMVNISQTKKHRESPPSMATMVLVPFCGWLLLNDRWSISQAVVMGGSSPVTNTKKGVATYASSNKKNTLNVQPQKTHAAKENWSTSLKWLTIMWITFDSSKGLPGMQSPRPIWPCHETHI